MPRSFPCFFLALIALAAVSSPAFALGFPGSNDNMFPSSPIAKPFIDFDGRGFLIHGQRTFIAAGSLHYSRVPRALWRDRLLRIKRAGYNTIQTYVFWNYHETREGQYDFSGDKDLNAYLQLIHSLGMYAIVRIGPYVNAEWDSGGWPVWLRFRPGVIVRDDDAPFLSALDRWLDHLMPIVSANQISRGGAVILVQLENEDTRGAGTDLPNAYFRHLRDKCVALGLEVPYFFSGLNHGDDPAGPNPLDTANRTSPWYSSEFWTGWINFYSTDPGREEHLERSTWRVIAYGGTGYSHYTIAGGTNFENWNAAEQGTNYDFGAPIGQAGDFRDVYYGLKRAAMFATSFPLILENSQNSTDVHKNDAAGVRVTARTSPDGTMLFLDNAGGAPVATQVKGLDGASYPSAGPLHVQPGEILPVVEGGYPLSPGIKIDLAAARMLTTVAQGDTTTLVVYGPPGDPVELRFAVPESDVKMTSAAGLTMTAGEVVLKTTCPDKGVQTFSFRAGDQTVRILSEDTDRANRTWLVTADGKNALVCGPDYVGEVTRRKGRLVINCERRSPGLAQGPSDADFLPSDGKPELLEEIAPAAAPSASPRIPALGSWSVAPGDPEAQPRYADFNWRVSGEPQPMGADGDNSAYAWYRTSVRAPQAGNYVLNFRDAGDWLSVFVNGVHGDSSEVKQRYDHPVPRSLKVTLSAGDNSVAVLAAHYGRGKLHAYVGKIDTFDAKGINGPVTLGDDVAIQVWKMRGNISWPGNADPAWQPLSAAASNDGSPKFYKTTFTMPALTESGLEPVLRVKPAGLSRGFLRLNGHILGRYPDWATITDLYLPPCWLQPGINTLVAFDENGNAPSQVQIVEETIASRDALQLTPTR